jgi:CRP-like cAMP-binding protein
MNVVQAHPLAELFQCPAATGNLLSGSAQSIDFKPGEVVFRQFEVCRGLYLVLSGHFLRRAEWLETPLTLGPVRCGDLVELAAVLGDGLHTYTLRVQSPGTAVLLPQEALNLAFHDYPPLRMQLLEELARQVSGSYRTSCMHRVAKKLRKRTEAALK